MTHKPRAMPSDRTATMAAAGWAAMMAAAGQAGGMSPGVVQALQRTAGNAAAAVTLEQDRHVQHATPDHTVQRSPVHEVLRRPGRPLDSGVRAEMEARLGADFGDVRVHTDAGAHEAAESVNAHAFTSGRDIVFQRGRYEVGTASGKEVLAHELIHVVQQRSGPVPGTEIGSGLRISDPYDHAEKEAEAAARKAMAADPPDTARERPRPVRRHDSTTNSRQG